MILAKDRHLGLHGIKKMFFAHINYLSGNGSRIMALNGVLNGFLALLVSASSYKQKQSLLVMLRSLFIRWNTYFCHTVFGQVPVLHHLVSVSKNSFRSQFLNQLSL